MAGKKTLLLLLKNPFSLRDYERMGIESLRQRFDLSILDCSSWLMPQTVHSRETPPRICDEVVQISSLRAFRQFVAKAPAGVAIDYVGQFSAQAILMFHVLKSAGFRIAVLDSGAFPLPQEWRRVGFSWQSIIYAFKSQLFSRALRKLGRVLLLKILPDQRPDMALVAGTSWLTDPRFVGASVKIPAHSFDYEKYRRINADDMPASAPAWALYIDESLPSHEDNSELGYDAPVSFERFSVALKQFFDLFEQESGMTVRIAAYPSARSDAYYKALFGDRDVVFGQTAELVKGAAVVFAHASTAISFAVLWRRPLAFLVSEELRSSWYMPWVLAPQSLLQAPLVDIDNELSGRALAHGGLAIDAARYEAYENTYLRSPAAPDASIWEIFAQGVDSCCPNS